MTQDCIELDPLPSTAEPGTTVTAHIGSTTPINVADAERYISEFVSYLAIPVIVNGSLSSQQDLRASVVTDVPGWESTPADVKLGDLLGTFALHVAAGTGEVSVEVSDLRLADAGPPGTLVLRQGTNSIRTFRSGFGLAVLALLRVSVRRRDRSSDLGADCWTRGTIHREHAAASERDYGG